VIGMVAKGIECGDRPRLREDCRFEVFAPDHLLILLEKEHKLFRGRAFVEIAPLLDGNRSADEVVSMVGTCTSFAEAYFAVDELERFGLLRWHEKDAVAAAWFDAADLVGAEARSLRISVVAQRSSAREAAATSLRGLALTVTDDDPRLYVVVVDDYLDSFVEGFNRERLADGRPWILVRPGGLRGWIGPLFEPAETACWACVAHRLREARQGETWIESQRPGGAPRAPLAGFATTYDACIQLAATEVVKWAGQRNHEKPPSQILVIDHLRHGLQRHHVVRRPQCATCGSREPRTVIPVRLSREAQRLDEATGTELDAFVSDIVGVVHSVSPGLPTGNKSIHTKIAAHYFPMFKNDLQVLQKNLLGRSGGKGDSHARARASAIGEALERYSGVWQGDVEPSRRATARALGDSAVPLNACLSFSPGQFANRKAWNQRLRSPHQVVPEPLEPDDEIDWTPAWSLVHDCVRYVPAAFCWYGHPDLQKMVCLADSNGCAAAGTKERAILAGLIELLERDATAIWWYNEIPRPGIDIASFGDPYIGALCQRYHALGRNVWALDITADFGVPVIVALSARRDGPTEDIIFGFGADLDVGRALTKAMTEMNQCYGFVSETAPDGQTRYRAENVEMLDWMLTVTRATKPFLFPADAPLRRAADYGVSDWTDPASAVRGLIDGLRGAGLDVFAIDQTRPDVGVPVFRMIVPGLRHIWRRLGPGRLYDVPVALGWLDQPRPEADLNPFSIFI
jgi:oxazoline/thiazoline synthase